MEPLELGSSRIFVRGLPPNLNAEDFKAHFSKHASVTDIRFMPHRRIGYVGYKSPIDAVRAVKYHNKSFIRMSRIGVELARSPEQQQALEGKHDAARGVKRAVEDEGHIVSKGITAKKSRMSTPLKLKDGSHLREFLQVMQPASKSKVWENQESDTIRKISPAACGIEPVSTEIRTGDTHVDIVPGTSRSHQAEETPRGVAKDEGLAPTLQSPYCESEGHVVVDKSDHVTSEKVQVSKDQISTSNQLDASSDADWLRSRTSRLLGLVDDDADSIATLLPDKSKYETEEPSKHVEQQEIATVLFPNAQIDQTGRDDFKLTEQSSNSQITAVDAAYGRLFVRNLTFTTTQDDLRQHFENAGHGDIEEVSADLSSLYDCSTLYMMNNLIGTADAMRVML